MDSLSFSNPSFVAYAIAASVMILKAIAMSWMTVAQMMRINGGFRSPEDVRKTFLNPHPSPQQLEPDERVERFRRIHMNDLENLPFFLISGLLFVLSGPPIVLAQWLLYGYALSRLLHFGAYATARTHDTRAVLWSVGSFALIVMTGWTLWAALHALTGAGSV